MYKAQSGIMLHNLIAPQFWDEYVAVRNHDYTFYINKGGRGSCKSTFISVMIPILLITNKTIHAAVFRKVGKTLKNSVYSQILWSIDAMGLMPFFKFRTNPMEIEFVKTGQKIIFVGLDDQSKVKSIRAPFGYFGVSWFEEFDQYSGMEEIRSVQQSTLRGGDNFWVFYSYNPPKSKDHWVNEYVSQVDRPDTMIVHTDYLHAPHRWLGDQFFVEARALKVQNESYWRHEYMGEVTGTGGDVFENVENLEMSDDFINSFNAQYYGLDFGFAIDPSAFVACYYNRDKEEIYIFDEVYGTKLSNEDLYNRIYPKTGYKVITADSAEPRTINELRTLGLNVHGAKKGRDSVEHGIKWLQHRNKIYVDKRRCPNTFRELVNYEYERNKDGQFISEYPDKDNHSIDGLRYAMERFSIGKVFFQGIPQ